MKLEEFIKKNKAGFQTEKMSKVADVNFEDLLKSELHQTKTMKTLYVKYLSIAACFVLILFAGYWFQYQNNISEETSQLLANLDANSVGKRLEGVYKFSDEYDKEDNKIVNRLTEIVLNDDNANVKIASIDALLKFPKNEKIRKSLIKALEKETEPLVQIKLIKAISFLRENRAQKSLEKIINNKETFPIVKNNATLAINNLKQQK